MLAKTKLKNHQFWSKNHDSKIREIEYPHLSSSKNSIFQKIREIEYPHIFLKKFNFSKNS